MDDQQIGKRNNIQISCHGKSMLNEATHTSFINKDETKITRHVRLAAEVSWRCEGFNKYLDA